MKTAAIILAAGRGSRMKSSLPKQYMELAGRPVLCHSVSAFAQSGVDEIVLVCTPGEEGHVRELCANDGCLSYIKSIVPGGSERVDSVECGLNATAAEYVLVHDGARPLISSVVIKRCIAAVESHEAVCVGVPSKDTVKYTDDDRSVVDTPDRSRVWIAQTPQAFKRELLVSAYKNYDHTYIPTDDTGLVEKETGYSIYMVEGEYTNIKITTPEDLGIAELHYAHNARLSADEE